MRLGGYNFRGGLEDGALPTALKPLFCASLPCTVERIIIPLVVESTEAMLRARSQSQISDEILEDVPAFTDFYSGASVGCVVFVCRIVTTSSHIRPYGILGGSCSPVFLVFVARFDYCFTLKASTTERPLCTEIASAHNYFVAEAAVTDALPQGRATAIGACVSDHFQTTELLTCQIDFPWTLFGHCFHLFKYSDFENRLR